MNTPGSPQHRGTPIDNDQPVSGPTSTPHSLTVALTPKDEIVFAEFEKLLRARFTCRAFTEQKVDRGVLQRVLEMAQRAPSWSNTQPWTSYVMSGVTLEKVRNALGAHIDAGTEMRPDLVAPQDYTTEQQIRRRQAGYALYGALGIDRRDHYSRRRQYLENFRFFGAPHVVVVTTSANLKEYGAVDVGGYITTMLLAAESLGIASCPQAAAALYAPAIRAAVDIPPTERIVATVSLGYADTEAAVNAFRTSRAPLKENVSFRD